MRILLFIFLIFLSLVVVRSNPVLLTITGPVPNDPSCCSAPSSFLGISVQVLPSERLAFVEQDWACVISADGTYYSCCDGYAKDRTGETYLSASGNVTYRTGCLSDNTCAGVGGPGNPLSQLFVVNGQNWQNFVSALNIWVMFWNETGTTLRTDEPLPCVTPFRVTLFPSPDTTGPPLTTPAPTPCPTPVPALPGLQSWQIIMIALNACLGVLMLGLLAAGFYFCPRRAAYEHIQ